MKHIFSIIAVALLLYLFTFYMDGEMGVILLAFLVFAPLISLIMALYGRNRMKISLDCDAYVKKGSELEVKMIIEKDGIFPLAVVEIVPEYSEVFGNKKRRFTMSMLTEEINEFTFRLYAETGGNGQVGIKAVYSCGFLGFLRLKAKTELPEPKSVGVIPEIPEVSSSSALFRNIADIVMTSDDDEDNDTSMLFSANTSPGYEHREYIPGDPLKRINWKLSSKSSKLMVRLDEAASAVQPCIALDLYRESSADITASLKKEEKILQSAFGLMQLMINNGIACMFVYRSYGGEIISENVDNPDYPSQLLLNVLAVKVEPDLRTDISASDSGCAAIIATTDISGSFSEIIDNVHDKENACVIVPSVESIISIAVPVWYLDEDNSFKQG